MTYFIPRFSARIVLAVSAILTPIAAAADIGMEPTVVSHIAATPVAAIEPVAISRSGLAVARVDLEQTGGIISDIEQGSIGNSSRPSQRVAQVSILDLQGREDAQGLLGGFSNAPRTPQELITSNRSRDTTRGVNRQLPASRPRESGQQAQPVSRNQAGPTYLLGVFR